MNKHIEIRPDFFWVGGLNPGLRVFDIVMFTPYGTTYNSYLVRGKNKIALFETVKEKHFDEFIGRIRSAIGDAKIDYLVLNHTEPDHAGCVARIVEMFPDIRVFGTKQNGMFIRKVANREIPHTAVTEETKLDLGGYTIQFIIAPFLHWPDTMFSYIPEMEALISCDFLGAHYSAPEVLLSRVDPRIIEKEYRESFRYYFDMIMGPFKSHVQQALRKLEKLPLRLVCPGHGLVLDQDISRYVNSYDEWSRPVPVANNRVIIPFVSAYHYTRQMAYEIARGVNDAGEGMHARLFDLTSEGENDDAKTKLGGVLAEIAGAKGLLVGSPTIVGDALPPIWALLTSLNPVIHAGRIAGVFGSFGWSGEGIRFAEERLKQLRFQMPLPSLKVQFKPSDEELEACYRFGKEFGQKILESGKPAS
jgi:flavorubredoxin